MRALAGVPAPAGHTRLCRLGLAGDCMWMRDSWASFPSDAVRALLASCDGGVVANLETVLHHSLPLDPAWLAQVRATP